MFIAQQDRTNTAEIGGFLATPGKDGENLS